MTMSLSSIVYGSFVFFANRQACKIYRSWINNQRLSASSMELDWDGVYINFKILQETVYFLLSGGDATFRNIEHVDSQYDAGSFGFAAGGVKTFIDCIISTVHGNYLANVQCLHKKSITLNAISQTGVGVDNLAIKLDDKNGDEAFNILTDAAGDAETQEVLFYDSDVDVNLNPFKLVAIKAGWMDKNFPLTIDAPKSIELSMTNPGLSEDEN